MKLKSPDNMALRKILATFLVLTVPATGIFPSAFAASPPQPHSFDFPAGFGQTEESFHGSSGKTIFYLQDAHDSLEAQENIAKLIGFFTGRGVKTVFEEGHEGPVPTAEYFDFFGDAAVREKISWFLMDRLRLSGAEYAHINRKQDFKLIGADSSALHRRNVRAYEKAAKYQKETEEDLQVLLGEIETLVNLDFPKPLKEWRLLKKRFDGNSIPLMDYLKRSFLLLGDGNYPAVKLLLAAETSKKADLLAKVNGISAHELFAEIERMENAVAVKFLKSSEARFLFQCDKNLRLFRRLNAFEITPPEYDAVKKSLNKINTRDIAQFIAARTHKSVVLSGKWEKNIRQAMHFYAVSEERDKVLAHAFEAFLKSGEQNAVLVFGGFHKNRITELLKEKQISFRVISPKITAPSPKHEQYYKELMAAGPRSFSPLHVNRAVSPERVFDEVAEPRNFPVYLERFEGLPMDLKEAVARAEARTDKADKEQKKALSLDKKIQNYGFDYFVVKVGDRDRYERNFTLGKDEKISFYFNIHTDSVLTDPSQTILARVYYQRWPGQWASDLPLTIYDNFQNGVYRVGITLPSYLTGPITFIYSVDGGKTWSFANHGPHENYHITRRNEFDIEGRQYRIEDQQPRLMYQLAAVDAKLPADQQITSNVLQEMATDRGVRSLAVKDSNGQIVAYLLYEGYSHEINVLRYAIVPGAPRKIITELWKEVRDRANLAGIKVLKVDVPLGDLQYFGSLSYQKIKQLASGTEEIYAVNYYPPKKLEWNNEDETEAVPLEAQITERMMLAAWMQRQKPFHEANLNFFQLRDKYPGIPVTELRTLLAENFIKPKGGFLPLNVEYREMTNDDIDEVMRIEEAAFDVPDKWSAYGFLKDERPESEREEEGGGVMDASSEDATRQKWVILSGGKIIGYYVYKIHDVRIEIQKIAIDPAYRFSGLGKVLINWFKKTMKEKKLPFISVSIAGGDKAVVGYFEKHGFVKLDEPPTDWQRPANVEMAFWDPEIDAAMFRNAEAAARYFKWLKEAKARVQEVAKEKLEKSPKSVIAALARKEVSSWQTGPKNDFLGKHSFKEAMAGHETEFLNFAARYSRFQWDKDSFRDFRKKGGKIVLAYSYGKIMGYVAFFSEGEDIDIGDFAFSPQLNPAGFLGKFIAKLRAGKNVPQNLLWEVPEKDLIALEGKESFVRAARLKIADIYPAAYGEEGNVLYLLRKQIRQTPVNEARFVQWAQSQEREPLTHETVSYWAEHFGVSMDFAYTAVKKKGIRIRVPLGTVLEPKPANAEPFRPHMRWMIRRDMPEVLQIERESFEFALTEEDFMVWLRQRNCIGMVAEHGDVVAGFMVYELHKSKLHILNFAVSPRYRRSTVGSKLIQKVVSKLSANRRTRITIEVRETNRVAQEFLKENGFEAIRVLRGFYEDTGEDAYYFRYDLESRKGAYRQEEIEEDEVVGREDGAEPEPEVFGIETDPETEQKLPPAPKEKRITVHGLLNGWAKRQPLNKLTDAAAERLYPEVDSKDRDEILAPIRRKKLIQLLLRGRIRGSGEVLPYTSVDLANLASMNEYSIRRIVGGLGFKLKKEGYSPLEVVIRPVAPDDLYRLAEIDNSDPFLKNERVSFDFSEAVEEGVRFLAAFERGRAEGYVAYRETRDGIEILRIRTNAQYRFRGIEEQLLSALKARFRNLALNEISIKVEERDFYLQQILKKQKFYFERHLGQNFVFTYKRRKLDRATFDDFLEQTKKVKLHYQENALAIRLIQSRSDRSLVLRTSLEELPYAFKKWFGMNVIVDKEQEIFLWKRPGSNFWRKVWLKSPVALETIGEEILTGIEMNYKLGSRQEARQTQAAGLFLINADRLAELTMAQKNELFGALYLNRKLRLIVFNHHGQIPNNDPALNSIIGLAQVTTEPSAEAARKIYGASGATAILLLGEKEGFNFSPAQPLKAVRLKNQPGEIEMAKLLALNEGRLPGVREKDGLFEAPEEFLEDLVRSELRYRVIAYAA